MKINPYIVHALHGWWIAAVVGAEDDHLITDLLLDTITTLLHGPKERKKERATEVKKLNLTYHWTMHPACGMGSLADTQRKAVKMATNFIVIFISDDAYERSFCLPLTDPLSILSPHL